MNITSVRSGIAALVDNISGLNVLATLPDSVNQTPAAYVGVPTGVYDLDMDDDVTLTVPVVLFVNLAGGGPRAQDALDGYLSPTGASSIKAAIETDPTLGGAADSARVVGFGPYDVEDVLGVSLAVARVDVEVYG